MVGRQQSFAETRTSGLDFVDERRADLLQLVRQHAHEFLDFVLVFVLFGVSDVEQCVVICFCDRRGCAARLLYLLNGTACASPFVGL